MNWLKENPFVSGLLFVTVAGCGALGFFLSGLIASHSQASTDYAAAVQELQGLQNRVPFPSAENLKKATEARDAYRKEIDAFRATLASMQVPLDPAVTPQQFQDNLRTAVNEITATAQAAKVKLPENFQLGFDGYLSSPPAQSAAPALQRQLDLVRRVVADLIGPKPENPGIRSLDTLARQPLPEEGGAASAADPKGAKPKDAKDQGPALPAKYPFTVAFSTEQSKLRIALNALVKSKPFLILRSLSLANSSPEAPKVASDPKAEAPSPSVADLFASADTPAAKTAAKEKLNVILGRELVKATAKIEMVDFRFPPPAQAAPKK